MLKIKTNQEYLNDMTYEELLEEDKKLRANPDTKIYEQLYMDILIGEKERELGYTYSLEEAFKDLISEEYIEYRNKNKCPKRITMH